MSCLYVLDLCPSLNFGFIKSESPSLHWFEMTRRIRLPSYEQPQLLPSPHRNKQRKSTESPNEQRYADRPPLSEVLPEPSSRYSLINSSSEASWKVKTTQSLDPARPWAGATGCALLFRIKASDLGAGFPSRPGSLRSDELIEPIHKVFPASLVHQSWPDFCGSIILGAVYPTENIFHGKKQQGLTKIMSTISLEFSCRKTRAG